MESEKNEKWDITKGDYEIAYESRESYQEKIRKRRKIKVVTIAVVYFLLLTGITYLLLID